MAVYGGNDPEYLKRDRRRNTETGEVIEALSRLTYHSDFAKKDSEKEEEHRQRDARMKHGKNWEQFIQDVKSAKERLRPGEVKRWDKKEKRWISNLEKTK